MRCTMTCLLAMSCLLVPVGARAQQETKGDGRRSIGVETSDKDLERA